MEDIGAEVSLKIKSAIKAKLVELGAYVDDELPDYIMVMVANKRSKMQMDTDLKLFLGSNTLIFTSWLHSVLQKLQEVTIASNLSKQTTQPVPEKPPTKSSKTSHMEGEDHKHKHKKKQRKSSDGGSKRKSAVDSKKASKFTEGKVIAVKAADSTEKFESVFSDNKIKDTDKITSSNGKSKATAKTYKKTLEAEIEAKQKLVNKSENKNVIENTETLMVTQSVSSKLLPEPDKVSNKTSYEKSVHLDDVVMETTTRSKVVYSSTATSPLKTRKSIVMQSDDEDFEDIINIKDTEMMDFLDAELPDELPKLTRTIVLAPATTASPAKPDPDMEVDDLEEQRAKLLRDLNRLENPLRVVRPTVDKYSVAKLLDRQGKPSALNRLGAIVDEPRLKLIDPDDFNIIGPPKDVEPPKLRMADRLGKKTTAIESEKTVSVSKRSILTDDGNISTVKVSSESKVVSRGSLKDDARRNVLDRIGKRISPDLGDERNDSQDKAASLVRKENDRKVPKEPERKMNVMDRLGTRPGHSSGGERTKRATESDSAKCKVGDRLGSVRSSSRERTSGGRNYLQREKRVSEERETFKSRFIDRLGKKEGRTTREEDATKSVAKEPERLTIMDRLGKKVTRERERHELPEREESKKRATRIISIKEALAGELHHSSGKRASGNLEEKEKEELPRKRLLLSRVVAVKRDPRLDEEADPDVAVASVIRVQPRPKVPAAMQANKNLLLKAMAEAQKSVAAAPIRQVDKAVTEHKEFLFTRKYRNVAPEKINITLDNTTTLEEGDAVRANVKQGQKSAAARLGMKIEDQEMLADDTHASEAMPAANEDVAMDKADLSLVDEEEDEVLEEIYEEDDVDSVVGNVSPIEYEGEEYAAGKVQYSTEDEPELQHNYNIKRLSRGGNTQFVVTLDGLDPLPLFNSRKRTVEQQHAERPASPLPVPEHESRIHNWLLSLERAKEEKERTASPVVYKKPRLASTVDVSAVATSKPAKATAERCKYWPACRQGDHCEFLHPTTPCKTFPSCKFGDKCLYVHPNCKFDTSCTRRECPYTHGGVRSSSATIQAVLPLSRSRSTLHAQPVCKFYPKCSNVNCTFQHPMPCRFGRSCSKSDCGFFHEEIPSTEKLKWVKTN